MSTKLEKFLYQWPKPYIRDQDLLALFGKNDVQRHDAVKYAIAHNIIQKIRRGLYLINFLQPQTKFDPFELAQVIYGPSYISLESALSYHGWIPEAVYITTSVSSRRTKLFDTPIGQFHYSSTPISSFYLNVQRVSGSASTFLIASPWKAIADYIYVYKKKWESILDVIVDLRVEEETIDESDRQDLEEVAMTYHNEKVRKLLARFYEELRDGR
jgi:hypothetical protein